MKYYIEMSMIISENNNSCRFLHQSSNRIFDVKEMYIKGRNFYELHLLRVKSGDSILINCYLCTYIKYKKSTRRILPVYLLKKLVSSDWYHEHTYRYS